MAVETLVEILEVLKYLQDVFSEDIGTARSQAYVKGLANVNVIKLRAGAEIIAQNNRYFPRLAEIRKAADLEIHPIDGFIRRRENLRRRSLAGESVTADWDRLIQESWAAGYWDLARYCEKVLAKCSQNEMATVIHE